MLILSISAMMKSKELKTKISHTHSLILSLYSTSISTFFSINLLTQMILFYLYRSLFHSPRNSPS